jgi:hypothetical protein
MPISTENAFTGPLLPNGVTVTFPFTFTALKDRDVAISTTGDLLALSPYSVSRQPEGGGSITFEVPPAAGQELFIVLAPEFTQEIEFANGAKILARTLTDVPDESVSRDQVLKGLIDRAILVPWGEQGLILPPASERADGILIFGPDGNSITVLNISEFVTSLQGPLLEALESAQLLLRILASFGGVLYESIELALANTNDGDEFAVDNLDGTASIYFNDQGVAVLRRIIIIAPIAEGSAAQLGAVGGTIQFVLDALGSAILDLQEQVDAIDTISGTVAVANGGTGATTAADARTNLGAAASGANADITSLRQLVEIVATGTATASTIGYRGLPLDPKTESYTLVANDAGRQVSISAGSITIPANSAVAFPIGTAIVIYNNAATARAVSIIADTLRLGGTGLTGTRSIAQRGFCTLVKVATTEWVAVGQVT